MELVDQLRRQLEFLRRSCASYDSGHKDEAVRLAVTLRTLLHDTARSISLLRQMGITDRLRFPSSIGTTGRLPLAFKPVMILPLMATSSGGGVTAPFHGPSPDIMLNVQDWWNEVVMKQGATFTRRDIVLSAANQDGGAHVDPSPSARTKELRIGLYTVVSMKVNGVEVVERSNHHFPLIRQFAYEVLKCQELVSMSDQPGTD